MELSIELLEYFKVNIDILIKKLNEIDKNDFDVKSGEKYHEILKVMNDIIKRDLVTTKMTILILDIL